MSNDSFAAPQPTLPKASASMHQPHLEEFTKLAKDHTLVPVYRTLLCDSLTPVSAFRRLEQGLSENQSACLFESVVGGERVGRYSFLTSEPFLEISAIDRQVTVQSADGRQETTTVDDPLELLRSELNKINVAHLDHDELPPFVGGAIGYAGYDVVRYTEHLPNAPNDDRQLPDMSFAFYDRMVVFDHIKKTLTIIVMADVSGGDPKQAYKAAQERLAKITAKLSKQSDSLPIDDIATLGELTLDYESNFTQANFEAAVNKCVDYIRAGDIFQVVISQRLQTKITVDPFEIYRTLRVVNPSPFMFYLRSSGTTLIGSSPEIMVRVVDGKLTVRPLAGTRPRGADEAEDQRLAEELLADPKERAEHVMLVDLGRNDVGRVAKYRTVELSDVMTIERYSHVMHITSNVTGQLRDDTDAFDALRACLPAGTVSGAPKVRAMEIIDELEPHRRGPYAGAVGYMDYGGNMDTCIALRTMVIQNDTAYVQAGAGIVADSVPTSEYQETLNKARGLLRAIEITEKRASNGNDA